jgi:lysophospholipid acyltransferase (LPLAT)-like uncharacterized protein
MIEQQEKIPFDAVSAALFILGEVLGRTWRFSLDDPGGMDPFRDSGKKRMYAFWHSNLLPLAFYFRNTGKTAVISVSRDGARAAAVARAWGHAVIHGSSSHGGALALRTCIRELQGGNPIVITPDGPRGQREIAKKGVAQIALIAGAGVIPISVVPERSWRLKSWDRFMIPKPFSRVTIRIGHPLEPGAIIADNNAVDHLTALIQKALAP